MRGATPLGRLEGAPLRCALEGSSPVADGLLVAGEAIGTTYSLTGEGIGKAMESGRFAADTARAALEVGRFDAATLQAYVSAMERASFPERFEQYRAAQRWVRHPFVVDLITRRARTSTRVRQMIEGMLREEVPPSELFSAWGMLRALVG
jgi:flavin-dependent dehydrogenase